MQIRYEMNQENYSLIPEFSFAYWISNELINVFKNESLYGSSISPSQNITGNNDKFVRKWWEQNKIYIAKENEWVFYAKGGGFRKWWGNLIDIIDWRPSARYIYQNGDGKHASQIIKEEYWYKKGITWGLITSYAPSFRVMPYGATFDKGGSTILVDENKYDFVLALLNSKIYSVLIGVFNPTLNNQVKDVRNLPIILENKEEIDDLSISNTALSKNDWDSFETSWDFKKHPLI